MTLPSRFAALAAVALVASGAASCKKSTDVDINQGSGGQGGNADGKLPDCPGGTAPGAHGPAMTHVGQLDGSCAWMDETEVTRAQYQAFVDANPGPVDAVNVAVCKGQNTALAPDGVPLTPADEPVAGVDWCDAAAFCAWAGKALCGSYPVAGAETSSFRAVCTDGDHVADFDYRELKTSSRCNGAVAVAVAPVRSFAGCVTPTLVFDLVGNVREWTAECDGDAFTATCRARGGSFNDSGESWGCDAQRSNARTFTAADQGFRCCAAETPDASGP